LSIKLKIIEDKKVLDIIPLRKGDVDDLFEKLKIKYG